jgi:hypothetical protein
MTSKTRKEPIIPKPAPLIKEIKPDKQSETSKASTIDPESGKDCQPITSFVCPKIRYRTGFETGRRNRNKEADLFQCHQNDEDRRFASISSIT